MKARAKAYAVAEKTKSDYELSVLWQEGSADAEAEFRAVMMSRPDFEVKVVELPKLPEREIESFLKYRIRSLYPGDPERTVFDYRLLSGKKKSSAVLFITTKPTLDAYRAVAGESPLFLPFNLVASYLGKYTGKEAVFLFWQRSWIEALAFDRDNNLVSLVIRSGRSVAAALARIRKEASLPEEDLQCILFAPDRDIEHLQREVERAGPAGVLVQVIPLSRALNRLRGGSGFLFETRKRTSLPPRKWRLQVLAILILTLAFLLSKKAVDRQERYVGELRTYVRSLQERTATARSLQREVDTLLEAQRSLQRRIPTNPYEVLSELRSIFNSGTRIRSFVLEKSFFQLEAEGSDPLNLMARFNGSKLFKDVKLNQIIPSKDSNREIFRITGTVHAE
jgi:hypothetical protein